MSRFSAAFCGGVRPASGTPPSPSMHLTAQVMGAVPVATHFVAHDSMATHPAVAAQAWASEQQCFVTQLAHAAATARVESAASRPSHAPASRAAS